MEGQASVVRDQDQEKTDASTDATPVKASPWLRQFHFRKGQSGNPGGKLVRNHRRKVEDWAKRKITQKQADSLFIPQSFVGLTWGQAAVLLLATVEKRPRSPSIVKKSEIEKS